MKRIHFNKLNLAGFACAMLAFLFYQCKKPIKNSERNSVPILQSHFELNGEKHPELAPLVFSDIALIGDYIHNNQQVVVFYNQLAKKVVYYQPKSDTVIKQIKLPVEAQGRWPITNFRVLGKDSLLYFNCNNQKLSVLNADKKIGEFKIPSPTKNQPGSNYSFSSIQGISVNNWIGLMAFANYEEGRKTSDSLINIQNLYSFFNVSTGELKVKSYPIRPFQNSSKHAYSYITFNDSLNRIDFYYRFSDTIKSYYLESGELETQVISKTKYPTKFEGIAEKTTIAKMHYDSISNYYVRKITSDTLLPNNIPGSSVYLQILNNEFETLHQEYIMSGQTPTDLALLSNGVYFGHLDAKRKLWSYSKVVYPKK